jgi:hypothetical protein
MRPDLERKVFPPPCASGTVTCRWFDLSARRARRAEAHDRCNGEELLRLQLPGLGPSSSNGCDRSAVAHAGLLGDFQRVIDRDPRVSDRALDLLANLNTAKALGLTIPPSLLRRL